MKNLIGALLLGLLMGAAVSAFAAVTQFNSVGSVQMTTSTVNGSLGLTPFDKNQLRLLTPTSANQIAVCNNCNFGTLMISTGVTRGAWIAVSSSTASNGGNL